MNAELDTNITPQHENTYDYPDENGTADDAPDYLADGLAVDINQYGE